MDEMTLTLNSPLTEEQWDMINDFDFDHTREITFHTKHGKEIKFIKESAQRQEDIDNGNYMYSCSTCYHADLHAKTVTVSHCGATMKGEEE